MNWQPLPYVVLTVALAAPAVGISQGDADSKARRLKKLMTIVKKEPTIRQVQELAVRNYRLETSRINGMASMAHAKGLIPELEGSIDNSRGNTFSNMRDGLFPILPSPQANPNPDSYKERTIGSNDNFTWRVRAVWNLDRLLFNPEALDAKSLTSLQENLVREVTTTYFARRRVLASLIVSRPEDDEAYFYELMRLEELTATIDAFTGGQFAPRTWQWDDPSWHLRGSRKSKRKR